MICGQFQCHLLQHRIGMLKKHFMGRAKSGSVLVLHIILPVFQAASIAF